MSELNNTTRARKIRKTLLATASMFVLAAYVALPETAHASDIGRPTVWLEGGWHFEDVTGENDLFVPPLDASAISTGLPTLAAIENSLGHTYGGEGSVSFQPAGSDWVFTASARYGRVQTTRRVNAVKTIVGSQMKQSVFQSGGFVVVPVTPTFTAYAESFSSNRESHVIADFQIGRDVGIGLFGPGTKSVVGFGARYAQMNGSSKAHSYAAPDATFEQRYIPFLKFYGVVSSNYRSASFMERSDSLHALGPSLSLRNTTGILGTVDEGQLVLDWGVNAALLFGRQKAWTSHRSTITHVRTSAITSITHPSVTRTRSRMVTVPNVGGFAALSYRFPNAKLSAGYRADFFFGARDGGLETRSTTDVGFHGPYATISIGLGG